VMDFVQNLLVDDADLMETDVFAHVVEVRVSAESICICTGKR